MIDTNLFQNSNLLWPVAFIALALWIVFIWKEWNSPLKLRFYLYSLIALITISSFTMIALKPLIESQVESNTVVLLTNGYNQKRLDSLKQNIEGITTINYEENQPIGETLDSVGNLFVLGNGVASYDFWQFENRSITYLSADVPDGIVDLKYDQESIMGQDLKIKGRYHNAKPSHKLVLQDGNAEALDSVVLDGNTIQKFEFSTSLKAKGKFVFELVEKDSLGELILSEPIPFKVVDKANFRILMVNGFPTFETKYLKNYLAEMGHAVVVRSQLTHGRYKFEYFNTKRTPIYRLEEAALASFDLLVIDGTSFRNLSNSAWTSIENTIKNTEMGLFVQPESGLLSRSSKRLGLKFEHNGISKVVLNEYPKVRFEKYPFLLKDGNGIEEIHSTKNNLITGYKRMEKGRIGTTVIQNTYELQLDGETEVYRLFWSDIVSKISKRKPIVADWEVTKMFPFKNEPFPFSLRTRIEEPSVFVEKNQVPLQQHVDIPSFWTGITYPKHQGWNSLRLGDENEQPLDFFVVDSFAWKPLRAIKRQKENRRYFTNTSKKLEENGVRTLINPIWFFFISVIGMAFLWLHPKVFPN